MPQIKIRGVELKDVCSLSTNLINDLEKIVNCPRNYFTIEQLPSTFIMDGNVVTSYPFVEVVWFDRGQEVQDKAADAITKSIQRAGYNNVDVVFIAVKQNDYYENGEHF
ncbi:MAG: DUF1904 domain-containing protein [Solirubrobacterales bacterium]